MPIVVDGEVWGLIRAAATGPEPLRADIEASLRDFTGLVATAISKTESREGLRRVVAEQAALRSVATLVAEGAAPAEVFSSVATGGGANSRRVGGERRAVRVRYLVGRRGVGQRSRLPGRQPLAAPGSKPQRRLCSRRGSRHRSTTRSCPGRSLPPRAPPGTSRSRGADRRRGQGLGDDRRRPATSARRAARVRWKLHRADSALHGARRERPRRVSPPSPSSSPPRSRRPRRMTICADSQRNKQRSRWNRQRCVAWRRWSPVTPRPTEVFESVATEVGKLLDTDITVVGRYDGDGAATAIGSWSASGGGVPVGTRSAIGGHNVLTIVAETGKPARVDGYDDASGEAAEIARRYGWRSSIAAPIVVEGRLWGVMLVASQRPEPFPAGAEERLAAFTDLVATAVSNTEARHALQRVAAEQAALRRVATLVARGTEPGSVFRAVCNEAQALLRHRQGRDPQVPRRPDGDRDGSLQCDQSSTASAPASLSNPVSSSIGYTRRVERRGSIRTIQLPRTCPRSCG